MQLNFRFLRLSVVAFGCCFAALAVPGYAQQADPAAVDSGPTVRMIEVQFAGPASISRDRILANMRTQTGQPYSELVVEEDIRSLYATGTISNVRIYSEPAADGVKVVVVIQSRATVREVIFEGVDAVGVNRLRKEITTTPGGPLSEAKLEEDRQKIISYYQSKGFGEINVSYRIDQDEAKGSATIVFAVNEGDKRIVRKIVIEGNGVIPAKDIRKVMKTKPRNLYYFWNIFTKAGRVEQEKLDADVIAIRDLYQEKGFADAEVVEVRREPAGNKSMDLVIVIKEGQLYTVDKLGISGNQLFTAEQIREKIKMVEGAPYSPKLLRNDLEAMQALYGTQGYIDLLVVPEAVSAGPQRVSVTYRVEEGFQSYVDRINIEGNEATKDKVIRRELAIAPGDVYNTEKVNLSRQRLNGLNYFSKVEAYPSEAFIPGRKDLNITVEEKRTGSFNFGVGFSSIDSLIGFVEVGQSNFDISNWPAFRGGGQRFRTRLQMGTERNDFVIGFTEPWFMDHQLAVGGEAFYREATYLSNVYDQRNVGASLNVRKPIGKFSSLTFDYTLQNVEIYDMRGPDEVGQFLRDQEGDYVRSSLGATYTIDKRDSVFLTRKGYRVEAAAWVAGGGLGGDVQNYGLDLEAAHYWSLPFDTIFQIVGQVGVVDFWGGDEPVQVFDALYLGGANTLRGFDYREVGPKDEFGNPIGGDTLARLTLEFTFPIIDRVRGAFFYDTGFVNADAYDWSGSNVNSDVGLGLRLDLPIGPIRLDFGIPVQSDEFNDSGGKFNFNVGYQF